MKKGKKKGTGVVLWSILTVLVTVLFAGACVGTNLAFASAQAVNIALKTPTHKTVGKDDSVVYYDSDFSSVEELEAQHPAPGCRQQGVHPRPFQRGRCDLRYRLCRYRHLQSTHMERGSGGRGL